MDGDSVGDTAKISNDNVAGLDTELRREMVVKLRRRH